MIDKEVSVRSIFYVSRTATTLYEYYPHFLDQTNSTNSSHRLVNTTVPVPVVKDPLLLLDPL